MTTNPVIATDGLTKRFGSVCAVRDLALEVRRGEIYAFLGENGAGKTTTVRMLLGLIRPSSGHVRVLGRDVRRGDPSWLRHVGYLVESATAYPNLSVRENLDIQRRLTGAAPRAVDGAIERLGLVAYADRRASRLSLGNTQRLALARALLHAPDLLILDEPANGLDPGGIVEIRRLLRSLADAEGVTVFMSSHHLSEVARLADRVGVVHQGRLIAQLDRAELAARQRAFVAVRVDDPARAEALLGEGGFADVDRDPADPGRLRVFGADGRAGAMARLLVGADLVLEELTPEREDLEQYFLRLTEEEGACSSTCS